MDASFRSFPFARMGMEGSSLLFPPGRVREWKWRGAREGQPAEKHSKTNGLQIHAAEPARIRGYFMKL